MKYLKLFEAFSKKDKVYETNSIFIDWLIFNWLVQNEIKVFQDPNSYSHYYRFMEPVTNVILFTLSDDIVGAAKARVGTEAYRYICLKPANIGHQDIINLLVKPLKRYIEYQGYTISPRKILPTLT